MYVIEFENSEKFNKSVKPKDSLQFLVNTSMKMNSRV